LKISHPDYGITEFNFPVTLKPKQCYEMVLVSNFNGGNVRERSKINYLVISADQDDAAIYIDDEYVSDREASKPLPIATNHTWRIECKYHHTESGTVTITSGDPIVIEKKMRPAFGYIKIDSQPSDAVVFINDERMGKTPFTSDKLTSGDYTVKVMKEMYQTSEQIVAVTDGNTAETSFDLKANFVNVTLETDSESNIFIDNVFKAKGTWTGRMEEGTHFVEARKTNHVTSSKNVEVTLGEDMVITIDAPQPITGHIDINTNPIRADIYIDGKHYGQTPKIIEDVTIGSHKLELKKKGYYDLQKNIVVKENEILPLNETLRADETKTVAQQEPKQQKTPKAPKAPKVKETQESSQQKDKKLDKATFINLNVAYSSAPQLSYGLTFGQVRKFGWYLSAMSSADFNALGASLECDENGMIEGGPAYYTGEVSRSRLSVIGGVALRVAKPLCLKVGLGYGTRVLAWHDNMDHWVKNTAYSVTGLDINAGMMLMLGKFNISADVVTTNAQTMEVKIGIGMSF